MSIAFLGTGLMGAHQVRCLLKAGHDVRVWNRTAEKARALQAEGAIAFEDPREATIGADVLVLMLEGGEVVRDVLFAANVVQTMQQGALVIDTSSIRPDEARDHADQLRVMGIDHLDAPVSGGVQAAADGTLAIMVGGNETAYARGEPILSKMGKPAYVGPAGSGQIAKLANQMIVGITIAAVTEALQLAERAGADPRLVRNAIRGGFAESRVLDLHGQRMIERDFQTRARATMQLKDLHNALSLATSEKFEAPVTRSVTSLFEGLVHHFGDTDHCALWLELDRLNQNASRTQQA